MEAVRTNTILEIEQTELKSQIELINATLPGKNWTFISTYLR